MLRIPVPLSAEKGRLFIILPYFYMLSIASMAVARRFDTTFLRSFFNDIMFYFGIWINEERRTLIVVCFVCMFVCVGFSLLLFRLSHCVCCFWFWIHDHSHTRDYSLFTETLDLQELLSPIIVTYSLFFIAFFIHSHVDTLYICSFCSFLSFGSRI